MLYHFYLDRIPRFHSVVSAVLWSEVLYGVIALLSIATVARTRKERKSQNKCLAKRRLIAQLINKHKARKWEVSSLFVCSFICSLLLLSHWLVVSSQRPQVLEFVVRLERARLEQNFIRRPPTTDKQQRSSPTTSDRRTVITRFTSVGCPDSFSGSNSTSSVVDC